jgi:hypothetical protein
MHTTDQVVFMGARGVGMVNIVKRAPFLNRAQVARTTLCLRSRHGAPLVVDGCSIPEVRRAFLSKNEAQPLDIGRLMLTPVSFLRSCNDTKPQRQGPQEEDSRNKRTADMHKL